MSSTTSSTPQAAGASVAVFGGDAPACNVVSFEVTVTGITLTPQSGGPPVSILSSNESVTVDFASLMGFVTMLNLSNVPPGTYSQMTIILANPQMGVLNASQSGMGVSPVNATLTSSTVTVDISPPLQVAANSTAGLQIDFNLLNSVQTNPAGAITGVVSPVFHASPVGAGVGSMMAEIDDLHGIVQSVTTVSNSSSFTGSFVLDQGMMGRTFTINVTGNTAFQGANGLSALAAGTFVEVNTDVDSNGNLVAKTVDVEEITNLQQMMGAFVGTVMSATRDASGNTTQFTMAVRGEYPGMQSMMPMQSTPVVNVTSSTQFGISASGANLANLTFGPMSMGAGQNVAVNGQMQMGGGMMGGASGLNAQSVVLMMQSTPGNFSSLITAGSDGKTGGFSMMPCSAMFGGQQLTTLTFGQTEFTGFTGLSGMSSQPMLLNKGLLFYMPNAQTINGVQIPASGMAFVATEVEKLQ